MAYMSQEKKAQIALALKQVVPAGWKYTLSVRNHSSIVFTLKQAPLDLLGHIARVEKASFGKSSFNPLEGYCVMNPYHLDQQCKGEVLSVMEAILAALNEGNHNNSDIQSDYHDVGWYVDMYIGKFEDPFLDTVPESEQPVKKWSSKPGKIKINMSEYSQYLPEGWASLSPGRKAAATKRAMAMAASLSV